MIGDFLSHLKTEWKTLKNAPLVFVIISVLVFFMSFFVIDWRYEGIVDTLNERLEMQKDRVQAKDDQLDEYRERLHLVPASGSEFSRLSHNELKERTLLHVDNLRKAIFKVTEEERMVTSKLWNQMITATSQDEKQRLWNAHGDALAAYSRKLLAEYNANFKINSILLRDELLSRFPKDSRNQDAYFYYEYPTNPLGMGSVADDLERLAKLLK